MSLARGILGWQTFWFRQDINLKVIDLRTKFLSKLVWRETIQTSHISFFLGVNFENLTVKFHVTYVLNMHIKFHSNRMLFTIRSINLFVIYNFKSQKLEILTFD